MQLNKNKKLKKFFNLNKNKNMMVGELGNERRLKSI
jgi:hypothetical protein